MSERSLLSLMFLLALVHLSDIQNHEELMSLTWFVNLHLLVLGDLQCTCYSRCLMIGMIFGIFATKAILLPKKTPNTHTKKASKQESQADSLFRSQIYKVDDHKTCNRNKLKEKQLLAVQELKFNLFPNSRKLA